MAIQLWLARMDRPLSEREYDAMARLLPEERRQRMERTPQEKHREVLCAYFLLRLALRERFGWKQMPEIAINSMGKPGFPAYPDVHFNLSHTTGAAVVALSDSPVGVDIERVRPVSARSMERLAGVRTPEEFFKSWVRREARVKRTGLGVVTMMRAETPLNLGEFYHEVEAFPGYVAGVATGEAMPPESVRHFVLDYML